MSGFAECAVVKMMVATVNRVQRRLVVLPRVYVCTASSRFIDIGMPAQFLQSSPIMS